MSYQLDPVTEAAWDCLLPVKCTLDSDLCRATKSVKPAYFMVPRQGYLFLSTTIAQEQFADYLKKHEHYYFVFAPEMIKKLDIAVEGDFVVPWQYPVGVILDRLAAMMKPGTDIYQSLPMQLVLKRAATDPVEILETSPTTCLPLDLSDMPKRGLLFVKSMLKAATWAQYRLPKVFSGLPTEVVKNVEHGILNNDPRTFYGAIREVRKVGERDTKWEGHTNAVLVKVHINNKVLPIHANLEETPSLGHFLQWHIPCCYDLSFREIVTNARIPERLAYVYISGSQPPMNCPLAELALVAGSPDMYLHLVIVPVASNAPRERPKLETPQDLDGGVNFEDEFSPMGSSVNTSMDTPRGPNRRTFDGSAAGRNRSLTDFQGGPRRSASLIGTSMHSSPSGSPMNKDDVATPGATPKGTPRVDNSSEASPNNSVSTPTTSSPPGQKGGESQTNENTSSGGQTQDGGSRRNGAVTPPKRVSPQSSQREVNLEADEAEEKTTEDAKKKKKANGASREEGNERQASTEIRPDEI